MFYAIFGVWIFDCIIVGASGASLPLARTAIIEIVFCENTKQGSSLYSEKLQGKFASIGSLDKAQGDVLQVRRARIPWFCVFY